MYSPLLSFTTNAAVSAAADDDNDGDVRTQSAAAGSKAWAEEEQEKGLLQDAWYRQRCYGWRDKESVQKARSAASSWLVVSACACCIK